MLWVCCLLCIRANSQYELDHISTCLKLLHSKVESSSGYGFENLLPAVIFRRIVVLLLWLDNTEMTVTWYTEFSTIFCFVPGHMTLLLLLSHIPVPHLYNSSFSTFYFIVSKACC